MNSKLCFIYVTTVNQALPSIFLLPKTVDLCAQSAYLSRAHFRVFLPSGQITRIYRNRERPETAPQLISRGIFHCWRREKLMSCHNSRILQGGARSPEVTGRHQKYCFSRVIFSLSGALHISGSFRCREHIEPFIQAQFLHVTLI